MRDPAAPPRLVRFVRSAVRVDPKPSFEDVLARWRRVFGSDVDTDLIRTIYDEELARVSEPRPRDARHSQIVHISIAIWLLANVALALTLSLPHYWTCRQSPPDEGAFGACGLNLGIVFFVVGVLQLVYGAVVSVIAYQVRPASTQGILIGMGVVLALFTVVCFGATAKG
jgi:hypothetical protein